MRKTIVLLLILCAVTGALFADFQPSKNMPQTKLSEDDAKAIALTDAGFKEDEVSYLFVRLDFDDRKIEYEVKFFKDKTEYEYDIDADTGKILKQEKEYSATGKPDFDDMKNDRPDFNNGSKNNGRPDFKDGNRPGGPDNGPQMNQLLTKDEALKIAVEHAGYTVDSVSRTKVKKDNDDGRLVYEIKFKADKTKYEYELDAYTGDILNWEIDD